MHVPDCVRKAQPDAHGPRVAIAGAGMVWGDKVEQGTWFGAGPVYALAINIMPYTPITEAYLRKDWLRETIPVLKQVCVCVVCGRRPPLRRAAGEWAALNGPTGTLSHSCYGRAPCVVRVLREK